MGLDGYYSTVMIIQAGQIIETLVEQILSRILHIRGPKIFYITTLDMLDEQGVNGLIEYNDDEKLIMVLQLQVYLINHFKEKIISSTSVYLFQRKRT